MALRLYDFKCPNDHVNERVVKEDTTDIGCLDCDQMAHKIISAVKIGLDPISGESWKATRKWTKNREQKIQQERKANS